MTVSQPADQFRPHARRSPSRAGGFTILELLIVIGIIALLATLAVLGLGRMGGQAQSSQTRTLLERLRNMTAVATREKGPAEKFFQVQLPFIYSQQIYPSPGTKTLEAIGPGDDDSLYRTGKVIAVLLQNAEAKAIFDELPANRKKLYHFKYVSGSFTPQPTGGAGIEDLTLPLDAWEKPIVFAFDNLQFSSATGVASVRQTSNGSPVGGLTYVWSKAKKSYYEPSGTDTNYVSPGIGGYSQPAGYTLAGTAIRAPDRRPFWASGGIDETLTTHDDNLYSFNN